MNAAIDTKATILVNVELPDPEPLGTRWAELLGSLKIILVGWYAVPEQTSPEQARDAFEGEARAGLDRVAEELRSAGADVHTHLVFTADELDTVERISAEENCDAVLIARPLERLDHVLVPMRGLHNAERISHFVADLMHGDSTDVTLLHVLEQEETEDVIKQDMLGTVAAMMVDEGMSARLIHLRLKMADDPGKAIIEAATDYDLVVIGETEPSVRDVIFGTIPEQIARKVEVPVMVVRQQEGPRHARE